MFNNLKGSFQKLLKNMNQILSNVRAFVIDEFFLMMVVARLFALKCMLDYLAGKK